jgi:hypothetical protein
VGHQLASDFALPANQLRLETRPVGEGPIALSLELLGGAGRCAQPPFEIEHLGGEESLGSLDLGHRAGRAGLLDSDLLGRGGRSFDRGSPLGLLFGDLDLGPLDRRGTGAFGLGEMKAKSAQLDAGPLQLGVELVPLDPASGDGGRYQGVLLGDQSFQPLLGIAEPTHFPAEVVRLGDRALDHPLGGLLAAQPPGPEEPGDQGHH